MNNNFSLIEELYDSRYKGNKLWENVIKKLTIRQAYVFYYSLIIKDRNELDRSLGIFSLPDENMIHKCLMDALIKENDKWYLAQVIGDYAHEIVINDKEILWIRAELRAALWLGCYMADNQLEDKDIYANFLRATSSAEYIEQLIQLLDIHGYVSRKGVTLRLRNDLDDRLKAIRVNSRYLFILSKNDYLSIKIPDFKLNWIDELSEKEIDTVIRRFMEEEVLILSEFFVPSNKKDKIELIKASLDMQDYKIQRKSLNRRSSFKESLSIAPDIVETEPDDVSKPTQRKGFTERSAQEIIDLLRKAFNSKDYRKSQSTAKVSRSFTLNKESNIILIALSKKLGATPKKVIEALVKGVDLEDKHRICEIDKLISGRRAAKTQLVQKKPSESEDPSTELEPIAETEKLVDESK